MTVRTLGIEEELLLLDPTTRQVSSRSHEVIKRFREHGAGRDHVARATVATDELDQELFLHQIETRTDPTDDLRNALAQVVAARRTAGEAARDADLAVVACGVVPMDGFQPVVTRNDRYQDMVERFGAIARTGGTCGMHVHVGIDSDEEGVHQPVREVVQTLVDAIRPALEEAGDLVFVTEQVESVLRAGGAVRQRAAYERSSDVEGVVDDLVARTEETWRA